MFIVKGDKSIHLTRGDVAVLRVGAVLRGRAKHEETTYTFVKGDVVRFQVFTEKNYQDVVLSKDVVVESESETVNIELNKNETKIGNVINAPADYWYEVELNPDTYPQTIIAHDEYGPKIFRLYPEGSAYDE